MPKAVAKPNAKLEYDKAIALARNPPKHQVYTYLIPKDPREFYEKALEIALKNPQLGKKVTEEPAERLIYIYAKSAKMDMDGDFGSHKEARDYYEKTRSLLKYLPPVKRFELSTRLDKAMNILARKEEEKRQRETEEAALLLRGEP